MQFRILAPSLMGSAGHEREYTRMIVDAARSLGQDPVVYCPQDSADLGLSCDVQKILPPLPRQPVTNSLAGRLMRKVSTTVTSVRRKDAYAGLFGCASDAHWLLHTAPYDEIAFVTGTFAKEGKGKLGVVLRYDHYDVPGAIALITRALAPARSAPIRLFADSIDLQGLLQPCSPIPILLTPPPVESVIADPPAAPIVGYFGSMRWQKGFHRLPDLFTAALDIRNDLRFLVQAYPHPDDPPNEMILMARARLAAMKEVTLIEQTLESSRFDAAMAACAAVVLPYDQTAYRHGTSGIFAAAIASGRATLSTANTWMTREAARAGLTRASEMPENSEAAGGLLCTLVETGLRRFRPNEAEKTWVGNCSPRAIVQTLLTEFDRLPDAVAK